MTFASSLQLFFLFVLSATGLSQDIDIHPTCKHIDQCRTLAQYVQDPEFHLNSSTRLVLHSGKHTLTTDLVVIDAFNVSIVTAHDSQVTVDCGNKASLRFENVSDLVIENVAFVSCGKISSENASTPGLHLSGVSGHFTKLRFTESNTGALLIANSPNVTLQELSVENNHDSINHIVHFEKSNINIIGTAIISNNSILESKTHIVVFQIKECNMTLENIIVSENIGMDGIVDVDKLHLVGNWTFERNCICTRGTLTLDNGLVNIEGNLLFMSNKVRDSQKCRSVAGMLLMHSNLYVTGDIDFVANRGHTTSIKSSNSQITVNGSLNLIRNGYGHMGVSLNMNSALHITHALNASYNFLARNVFNAVTESSIIVDSESCFTGNNLSDPIAISNGIVRLAGKVDFTNNVGAIFAFQSQVYISGTSTFTSNSFDDDFLDGAVGLEHSTLVLSGNYSFVHNQSPKKNGGAIFATKDCKLNFSGNGNFTEHSGLYGGAIYLDQRSQINIRQGTSLQFHNNTAIKGGAIYIQALYSHINCISTQCLFLYENNSSRADFSFTFTENVGNPGGSVMHANIDKIDFKAKDIRFPALDSLTEKFIIPDNSNNTEPMYHSDSFLFCFCTNDSIKKCETSRRKSLMVVRRKPFYVMARAVVVYGNYTQKTVKSTIESSPEPGDSTFSFTVKVDGGIEQVDSSPVNNMHCSKLGLMAESDRTHETVKLVIGESFLDDDKTLYLDITFEESCPTGFNLNERNTTCVCDSRIESFLEKCDITEGLFKKKSDFLRFWMGPVDNTSDFLYFRACPHGYCEKENFTLLNDRNICANNRTGRLCGECIDGCSLLIGGVKCEDCSEKNSHLALLIVFAALGVILVALIFLTKITVAMGAINGLILYINVINVSQNILLPSDFFQGYTIFLSWLNLDFGIETCFYNGMNQLQYAAWQFVFPMYLWMIVGGIVLVCRYSTKISNFFGSSDPVAVLATIILLTYNTLIQNIVTIFSHAHLIEPDDSTIAVWLYNGEISYATGFHIGLIVAAVVFLILFFAPYTLVLAASQLLQKLDCTSKILQRLRLIPFINAYQAPFKPAHRYWVGLCLMMRAMVIAILAGVERESVVLLAVITFCIVSLSMFGMTGGVYNKRWLNIVEISFILNLVILSVARLYITERNAVIAYISVTAAFIAFLGIVAFHTYERLKKQPKVKKILEKVKCKLRRKKPKKEVTQDENSLELPGMDQSHQVALREPLLESRLTTSQQN